MIASLDLFSNQTWYNELVNFITESKNEVEFQTNFLIDSAKKWQHKTNERFDMIHHKFVQEHNLENASTNDEQRPIEQQAIPTKPVAPPVAKPKEKCHPSMPGKFNNIRVKV